MNVYADPKSTFLESFLTSTETNHYGVIAGTTGNN